MFAYGYMCIFAPMNYQETIAYLFAQLPMFQRDGAVAFHYKLDKTRAINKILGNPCDKLKFIHIAGTNGKGSVSHFLASILQEAGYKTGLYTSPHLKDFRERIRINGEMIPQAMVIDFVEKYKSSLETLKTSFFEYSFGMAMDYFAKQNVDIVVLETGMGGKLDSTNIVQPLLTIITNISMDHTLFLGDSLTEIAGEKAGIIKKNIPLIIGETQIDPESIFRREAEKMQAPISFADQNIHLQNCQSKQEDQNFFLSCQAYLKEDFFVNLRTPLSGFYQRKNLITTMMAVLELQKMHFKIDKENTKKGLLNVIQNTGLQGRWQILKTKPLVICDTGHNKDGLSYVVSQLKSLKRKIHFVFGTMKDKSHSEIFALLPEDAIYYFCKPKVPRGMEAGVLQTEARQFGLFGESYSSVREAYLSALQNVQDEEMIFVGGSTFVVAEVL